MCTQLQTVGGIINCAHASQPPPPPPPPQPAQAWAEYVAEAQAGATPQGLDDDAYIDRVTGEEIAEPNLDAMRPMITRAAPADGEGATKAISEEGRGRAALLPVI